MSQETGSDELGARQAALEIGQQNLAVERVDLGQVAKENVRLFGQLHRYRMVRVGVHQLVPVTLRTPSTV